MTWKTWQKDVWPYSPNVLMEIRVTLLLRSSARPITNWKRWLRPRQTLFESLAASNDFSAGTSVRAHLSLRVQPSVTCQSILG